jgi:VCBS repeat protein/ASPIC/UnbV protein
MGIASTLALTVLLQVSGNAKGVPQQSDVGTPAEEFRRIGQALYDGDCPQYGSEPARTIERMLEKDLIEPERRAGALSDLGREYLEQGKVAEAIALFEEALLQAENQPGSKTLTRLHRDLALANLRLAENQNCIERHVAACCILPLEDGGKHVRRDPAIEATKHYLWLLERKPDDLGGRWVLNLLAMLLGEYPDSVPDDLRVPLGALQTTGEEPLFRDVASSAGVDSLNLAGGVAAEDYDGDGWIDILTSTCDPLGPLLYYRNSGDGTFEDRSSAAGASAQLGGLNLISGDYDNDGDKDALVLRGGWLLDYGQIRKSLLRNDGTGVFEDVTRAAGVAEPAFPTQTAVFADLDSDGWLDLYVGHESRVEIEAGKGNYPSQYFHSRGDGTFRNATAEAGLSNERYAKGVAAGDYDDDGDMDLYVSNIGKNRLYKNDGKGRFEDVAAFAHVEEPNGRSFATWFFDYDNDGHLDLWVGGYATSIADLAAEALGQAHTGTPPCLYRNLADGTFRDMAKELGLSRPMLPMGANFGDIDNDGWLDMYLGTGDPLLQSLMPNMMFRNDGGKRFEDYTGRTGTGHLQKGHGISFTDFDHDGDEDIFHQLGGFVPVDRFQKALFENRGPQGHWLKLELEGTRTNRLGYGARIKVVLDTPNGPRELHRAAGSVSSFGGSASRLEIGLGDATRIARLEIRWPRTAEVQVLEDVPLDGLIRVREGETTFERREQKRFTF